jgi:hypothetical protein
LPPIVNVNGLGNLVSVSQWPFNGGFPGNLGIFDDTDRRRGELICFAVDNGQSTQIRHNHLSGTATIIDYDDLTAFEYNAWAFTARNVLNGAGVGTPGRLDLNGSTDPLVPGYDACPKYNIAHIVPNDTVLGTILGDDDDDDDVFGLAHYEHTHFAVSTCTQDLRQDFNIHVTKVNLVVWNEQEVKFTGAHECIDSVERFRTDSLDVGDDNFEFFTLLTGAAHVKLRSLASTQCDDTGLGLTAEVTGLVATVDSDIELHVIFDEEGDDDDDVRTGVTTRHAGVSDTAATDFILWDPGSGGGEPDSK